MKQLIGKDIGSYSFNPSRKEITFYNIPSITQEQILLITNTTDGVIIYNFADSSAGGSLWGNVLTLTYNTASMNAEDHLQIYIDIPSNLNSTTTESNTNVFIDENYSDTLSVFSTQIENVLGNSYLVGKSGGLKVEDQFVDQSVNGVLILAQSQIGSTFNGKSVAVIQVIGTWAGTLTFEGTATTGDWVTISGQAINGALSATSTTANGIFRFNITGLTGIRVRWTTYTSGQAIVTINVSSASTSSHPNVSVTGSQSQPLIQRATTYEANTYDTNLATVLGTSTVVSPQATPLSVAPVAPTTNAGAIGNAFNNVPSIYPRIRVEVAGSEKQPLSQEKYTNRLQVVCDECIQVQKQILMQLKVANCLTMQQLDYNGFKNLQVPSEYEDILTKIEQRGN